MPIDFAYTFQTDTGIFVLQRELEEFILDEVSSRVLSCFFSSDRILTDVQFLRIEYDELFPPERQLQHESLIGACPVTVPEARACWYLESRILATVQEPVPEDRDHTTEVQQIVMGIIRSLRIRNVVPNALQFQVVKSPVDMVEPPTSRMPGTNWTAGIEASTYNMHPGGIAGLALGGVSLVCFFLAATRLSFKSATDRHHKELGGFGDSFDEGFSAGAKGAAGKSSQPLQIDFLADDKKSMTVGRRIALSLLKYKSYNPLAYKHDESERHSSIGSPESNIERRPSVVTKMEIPSLEKAWAVSYQMYVKSLHQSRN